TVVGTYRRDAQAPVGLPSVEAEELDRAAQRYPIARNVLSPNADHGQTRREVPGLPPTRQTIQDCEIYVGGIDPHGDSEIAALADYRRKGISDLEDADLGARVDGASQIEGTVPDDDRPSDDSARTPRKSEERVIQSVLPAEPVIAVDAGDRLRPVETQFVLEAYSCAPSRGRVDSGGGIRTGHERADHHAASLGMSDVLLPHRRDRRDAETKGQDGSENRTTCVGAS